VVEVLLAAGPQADLRLRPDAGELRALAQQGPDDLPGQRVRPVPGEVIAQQRGLHPPDVVAVAGPVQAAGGGVGEPAVHGAPGQAAMGRLVAQEGDGGRRLPQGDAGVAHDLGRRVVQPVQDARDPRVDVLSGRDGAGSAPAQGEEVAEFRPGQPEPAGQGQEHAVRRPGTAAALEAADVVRGHPAQLGDLLPAQPAGPAARSPVQAQVLGPERFPAGAQELAKCCLITGGGQWNLPGENHSSFPMIDFVARG
jgi:hypothetical protein